LQQSFHTKNTLTAAEQSQQVFRCIPARSGLGFLNPQAINEISSLGPYKEIATSFTIVAKLYGLLTAEGKIKAPFSRNRYQKYEYGFPA